MHEQLKLDNQICFRIYTAQRLLTQAYRPLLEPIGLTYPQYLVMLVLWEKDNQLVGNLCRRLMLDTNTITPLLQRMEKAGLVVRTHGIADGRQTLVSLTKKGRSIEEQAKDVPACLTQCWQGEEMPSLEAVQQFVATLDTMINMLKK
ncbi:MAG: MarR family transcriptional regulator [Bacteroidales bacterium]|nr:MarR family transcriptional regulator [Bacteroidales bacterium]